MHGMPLRCRSVWAWLALVVGAVLAGCASREAAGTRAEPWRAAVAAAAEQMLGAPYRYGGESPDGFDCSGLVAYSYARAGIRGLPRTAAELYRRSSALPLEQLLPGDLLFFAFDGDRASHVAIYVGKGRFVHAHKSGRAVESVRLDDPRWRSRLTRGGRLIAR